MQPNPTEFLLSYLRQDEDVRVALAQEVASLTPQEAADCVKRILSPSYPCEGLDVARIDWSELAGYLQEGTGK